MKLKLFIATIFISFIYMKIINTEKLQPWLIYDNYIYFIDTRPNFTSDEMEDVCFKANFMNTIGDVEYLTKAINQIYGYNHEFWTVDNVHREDFHTTESYGDHSTQNMKCSKLTTNDGEFYEADCSQRLGLICQNIILGATVYYKNGTTLSIEADEVQSYCDPHDDHKDKLKFLCLINLFQRLL